MLDRELQHRLLEAMRKHYPAPLWGSELDEVAQGIDHRNVTANVAYLIEHDLADGKIQLSSDGARNATINSVRITAPGLDFLEDDGGLSAILGVVTVRLHADTIRDLLALRIEQEPNLSPEEKTGLIAAIKRLPETSLQAAAIFLTTEGLAHLPNAIDWLRTLVAR